MERITKIAENHVQVQTVYFDEKVNGEEKIVSSKTYGQRTIDDERAASEARTAGLDALDSVVEKTKEVAIRERLAQIKTVMDS